MSFCPIEAGEIVLQRGRDLLDHAGARGGEETLEVSASMPLIITLRTILIAAAAPILAPPTLTCMPSAPRSGATRRHRSRRAALASDAAPDESARARRHRYSARAAEKLRGFLLAPGRHRVDIEEIRFSGEMRLDRSRGLDARSRGDRGDDDVCLVYAHRWPKYRTARRLLATACRAFRPRAGGTECPTPPSVRRRLHAAPLRSPGPLRRNR